MKMISLSGALGKIKDIFVAAWKYVKKSKATFSSLGDELITSAQTDLTNLKTKLEQLWEIKDEDKETTALYLASLLGKFGFTFIITGVSLMASFVKLMGASCCLFLAGRWLTLLSKTFDILRETITQGLKLLQSGLKKLATNILELCDKLAHKISDYASRFLNSMLNILQTLTDYITRACKTILDFAAAAYRSLKHIFTNLGNAIINCCAGVGHLILGTLRAGCIVAYGTVLSVAALFIETGIASSLSGVAKTMFILDESLAGGMGALMDGVYASGNSFIKASKALFGYGATTPGEAPVQESVYHSTYFSRKLRDNMHYVNECVASVGNELLSSYQMQRNSIIGASGWSHPQENDDADADLVSSRRQSLSL